MALQWSTTTTPRPFACKSQVGKAASFPPPVVNFSSRASFSPRCSTSVADNLRLLGAKSNWVASLRCFASEAYKSGELQEQLDKAMCS